MTSAVPLALVLFAGSPPAVDFSSVVDFGPFKPGLAGADLDRTLETLDARRDESFAQTSWVYRREDGARGRLLLDGSGALDGVVFEQDLTEPESVQPIFAALVARYGTPTWDHPHRKIWRNATINLSAAWSWVGNGGVRASESWTHLPKLSGRGWYNLSLGETLEEAKRAVASDHPEETEEGGTPVLRVDGPCRTVTAMFERGASGWTVARVVVMTKDLLPRSVVEGWVNGTEESTGKPDQVTRDASGGESYLWRGRLANLDLTIRPAGKDRFAFIETWTQPTEQ